MIAKPLTTVDSIDCGPGLSPDEQAVLSAFIRVSDLRGIVQGVDLATVGAHLDLGPGPVSAVSESLRRKGVLSLHGNGAVGLTAVLARGSYRSTRFW